MAKKSKTVDPIVSKLQSIANGTVTRLTKDEALPLLQHANGQLIDVNTNDVIDGKAFVILTEKGKEMLASLGSKNEASAGNPAAASPAFALISGFVPPETKRGAKTGGGAPNKYPFDALEVFPTPNSSFFVPTSTELPDPFKTLSSAVASANRRYATETGETEMVKRAKRDGRKAMKDADGKKIMEEVSVPVYKHDRKFNIRGIVSGKTYGEWTAPADGAMVTRVI